MYYRDETRREPDIKNQDPTYYTIVALKEPGLNVSTIFNKGFVKAFESIKDAASYVIHDFGDASSWIRSNTVDMVPLYLIDKKLAGKVFQLFEVKSDTIQKKVSKYFISYTEYRADNVKTSPVEKMDIFDICRAANIAAAVNDSEKRATATKKAFEIIEKDAEGYNASNPFDANIFIAVNKESDGVNDFIDTGEDTTIVIAGLTQEAAVDFGVKNYLKLYDSYIKPKVEALVKKLNSEIKEFKFEVKYQKYAAEIYIFHKDEVGEKNA